MKYIIVPFAWLLNVLYDFTGNYGLAVILFAVVVRLILLPFQMRSKKSMMRMSRLTPKVKELEKKYSGNQQKYNEEVQKLYKRENIHPMSGCLWSLIPFPILLALYGVIRQPLTKMMGLASEAVESITTYITNQGWTVATASTAYSELPVAQAIHEHFAQIQAAFPELTKLRDINFNFLGMNLSEFPKDYILGIFGKGNFGGLEGKATVAIILMILIPILSGVFSWLSMTITQKITGQQTEQNMKAMNLFMPLFSVYIAFVMPASLGVYWIISSVLTVIQEVILTTYYKKKLDAEDAVRQAQYDAEEAERERKREETARLKAENATKVNPNTSKNKIRKQESQKSVERANEYARVEEKPVTESRVGDRPFARGRAYVADRFDRPAEEKPAEEKPAEEAPAAVEAPAEDAAPVVNELPAEVTADEEVIDEAETEEAEEEVEESEEDEETEDASED